MAQKRKVLFFIPTLSEGTSAESLVLLISRFNQELIEPYVMVMGRRRGALYDKLKKMEIRTCELNLNREYFGLATLKRMRQYLMLIQPDILQGWGYQGNLFAWIATWIAESGPKLYTSIRDPLEHMEDLPRTLRWMVKWDARFSKKAKAVVYTSKRLMAQHEAVGYCKTNRILIPNGFGPIERPSSNARKNFFNQQKWDPDLPVIGAIAPITGSYDYQLFCKAAALLLEKRPDVNLFLAGSGIDYGNHNLMHMLNQHGISGHIHLLGRRKDEEFLYSYSDIITLLERRADPNDLARSMQHSTLCAAPDMGDLPWIMDNFGGALFEPGNYRSLVDCWITLLDIPPKTRAQMIRQARQRIVAKFSVDFMTRMYQALYNRGMELVQMEQKRAEKEEQEGE